MAVSFVRKKRAEEACEEHIATETVSEDEAGRAKMAGLETEELEKVEREFNARDCPDIGGSVDRYYVLVLHKHARLVLFESD